MKANEINESLFFPSVDAAMDHIQQHEHEGDHEEKELNGVLMFGIGIYAYSDVVTFSGVADCTRTNDTFYHFKDTNEVRRFVGWLKESDGYLEVC